VLCGCQEMAKILNHPRVYSFLHVPVQSGSDSVLMDMRREYCQADFRHVVEFLRQRFHCNLSLCSVVIVSCYVHPIIVGVLVSTL